MIKLFLSDLDGTLIDNMLDIKKSDLQAIDELRSEGIDFGIVTGRDLGFFLKYIKQDLNFQLDYIGNNGATLYVNDEKLYEMHIEAERVQEVVLYLLDDKEEIYPFVADEDCKFYYLEEKPMDDYWLQAEAHMGEIGPVGDVGLLEYLKNPKHDVVKISFWTKDVNATKFAEKIRARFGDVFEASVTAPHFVEVTGLGINKGTTIQKLLDHLGIKQEEVAVIGDGENDIPMLDMIPNAFVMENAKDNIKQYGRVVRSVEEAIDIVLKENK